MKKKVVLGLKWGIIAIVLLLSILFFRNIIKLDVVPMKYLVLLGFVLALLNIVGGLSLFFKKIWLRTFTVLSYGFLLGFSLIGGHYAKMTNQFFDEGFSNYKVELTTYHVIVRSSSEESALAELENKSMAYYTFFNEPEKVINTISNQVNNISFLPHDDLYDTFINFLVGQYDSLIVTDSILDILSEDYKNLDERIKILYTFEIEAKVNNTEEKVEEEIPKVENNAILKGDNFNIYISGSDSRSTKIANKSRSDVNMVVSINKKTRTVLLTSIPRDYYVMVHGQTGLKDKLTHAGIYGLERSKQTVEDLFDINIDYSIKLGFSSVVELVDLVGGIDIHSDTSFDSYHIPGWHVNKGVNHMDGAKALAYARERYAYASGDRHRILNQQQVLEATFKKLSTSKNLLLHYDELLNSLSKLYITDIPKEEITSLVKMQLEDMSSWTFLSSTVDGTGKMAPTHVAPKTNLYVMEPNEATVTKARNKMKEVLEAK